MLPKPSAKLYCTVPMQAVNLIHHTGLQPKEFTENKGTIPLADSPELSLEVSCLEADPHITFEITFGEIDAYSMISNEAEITNLLNVAPEEDFDGARSWREVPWTASLKHVGQASYTKTINPSLLTICKINDPDGICTFTEESILNPKAKSKLWKEEVESKITRRRYGFLQEFEPNESCDVFLPKDVQRAFVELGLLQRDLPERTMLKAQDVINGSVLSDMLEHIGDLTHRMSHHAKYNSLHHEYFAPKVAGKLNSLTIGYGANRPEYSELPLDVFKRRALGFLNEYKENIEGNAKRDSRDLVEYEGEIKAICLQYAEEHAKLPVYNQLQWMAREAAISVGKFDFERTVELLTKLNEICQDVKKYNRLASQVHRDKKGNILQYSPDLVEQEYDVLNEFSI